MWKGEARKVIGAHPHPPEPSAFRNVRSETPPSAASGASSAAAAAPAVAALAAAAAAEALAGGSMGLQRPMREKSGSGAVGTLTYEAK